MAPLPDWPYASALPTSVLNGGHVGSDCHVINPLYSTGEWSAADVFALPPEGFSRLAQILPRKTV